MICLKESLQMMREKPDCFVFLRFSSGVRVFLTEVAYAQPVPS